MNSVEGLRSFRSRTKLGKFLGHVIFNESLNEPKTALNIMNEGKYFWIANTGKDVNTYFEGPAIFLVIF